MACGKHPVANDFFQIGQQNYLGSEFCTWARKGYEKTVAQLGSSRIIHSWRFWTKGSARNDLILGLLRDSSDARGRLFPLLIVGIGAFKGWTRSWSRLPLACAGTWQTIEHLSATRLATLNDFETHLSSLRPNLELLQNNDQRPQYSQKTNKSLFQRLSLNKESDPRSLIAFQMSTNGPGEDAADPVVSVHLHLQTSLQGSLPQAVFMGGTMETQLVLSFFRPLTAHDFLWMWSITDME